MKRYTMIAGVLTVVFLGALSCVSLALVEEIIAGGKLKYMRYCAYCHGSEGKGDGDMSALLVVSPADLTQISKRNKGVFPFWQVYQMIDGRQEVRGHGDRTMPIWGFIFQAEEDPGDYPQQIDAVRGRIWQLVYYLESIQKK
jgi:mono/diheme cytochrome c family protein